MRKEVICIKALNEGYTIARGVGVYDLDLVAAKSSIDEVCDWLMARFSATEGDQTSGPFDQTTMVPDDQPEDDDKVEPEPEVEPDPEPDEPDEPEDVVADDPEPVAAQAAAPTAPFGELTPTEEKLYEHLVLCCLKGDSEQVIISASALAKAAGISPGSITYMLSQLEKKDFIKVKKPGRGYDPVITVPGALEVD